MDKKLDARLAPMENNIKSIKLKQRRINSIIENEIRSDIKLLTENYEPVAKQYEKGASKIKAIQYDILYYENMSLVLDITILIYTVRTVFTGKGI